MLFLLVLAITDSETKKDSKDSEDLKDSSLEYQNRWFPKKEKNPRFDFILAFACCVKIWYIHTYYLRKDEIIEP